jgi:four helix bundle protein
MGTITRFEEIEAWKKARELRQMVYQYSKREAFARDMPLRNQIRRAALSVTANIAEGFERGGNREFVQFLSNAKGSCAEIQDHLYAALDERYVSVEEFNMLYGIAGEVARLTAGFMQYLQHSPVRGPKFRTGSD